MKLNNNSTLNSLVFNAITNNLTLEYLTTLKQLGKFKGDSTDLVTSYKDSIDAIIGKIEDDTGLVVGSQLTYNGFQYVIKSRLTVTTDADTLIVYAKIDGIHAPQYIEVASFKLAMMTKSNDKIGR